MTADELREKTSAAALYRAAEKLTEKPDAYGKVPPAARIQAIASFHVGAAVVRALDGAAEEIRRLRLALEKRDK